MASFSDFELHERLLKAIDKQGFTQPTEVQAQVIPEVFNQRDLVVSAKTGSGKTAAFLLPMLMKFLQQEKPNGGTRGLILLPTRELALQTEKMFQTLAGYTQIKCGVIIGGEPFKYQISTIRRNPEVIIATPGRLVEHLNNGNMDFSELEFLVLDEADRMLDMGFAEDLHRISEDCSPERQNILLSATFKHKGFSRVRAQLKDPKHIQVDAQVGGHAQIHQQRILADSDEHKQKLVAGLIKQEQAERVFVFCNTRVSAQKLSNLLSMGKIRSGYLHGEVAQSDRKQILNRFREGNINVLVTTDVAARGLDVDDVDLVINFHVPHSGDDYVHRIGRTGRRDKTGLAVTLVKDSEWHKMSSIERYLKFRFETRTLKGLIAKYKGPKKVKKSGKAAGTKKKDSPKKDSKKPTKNKVKSKAPATKRSAPRKEPTDAEKHGFAPLRKKPRNK